MVPMRQKHVNRKRGQRGPGERDHDGKIGAQMPASVDFACIEQFARQLQKKLAEQEHPESAGHKRNDQPLVAVHPAPAFDQQIVRNDRHFPRNHHGRQKYRKQRVFPFEIQERKSVSRQA